MAWRPEEDGLRQLSEYLKNSLSGHDRDKQKEAELMLMNARNNNDYVNYLTYIFSTPELSRTLNLAAPSLFLIRYAAAVNLKNHIKLFYSQIPPDQLAYIKAATLNVLRDANSQLRSFAGTVITETVQQGGLLQWPEILQELLALVSNTGGNVSVETQEGAMGALAKVCEDNRKLLDKEFQGQRPMAVIVPKLLEFASHPNPKVRTFALGTLKSFIPQKSQVLFSALDVYLQTIFQLASDPDVQVRRIVCQSLVQLVDSRPDMLIPHLEGLVNYILAQQQSADHPELALDAAEFWLSVGEQDQLRDQMGPYLGRIIPVLLAGMVYGEEDALRLGGDENNADVEDRVEDIKPQFAQVKAGRGVVLVKDEESAPGTPQRNGTPQPKTDLEDGEVDDDDEDEDDWDDEDPENAWSLRKCSAAALDVFAVNYHSAVFEIILPYLKENLSHTLWPKREAAVLALGAVAEGCMEVVSPHLPELVPFLISRLSDEEPVVRQITCWCLARYSEWAARLETPAEKQRYFEPMMEGLLQRMLDNNKKVQEAGASSFASLEEKSGDKLKPYVEPILRQFTECFRRYKDKNMYILYDCLQTLADNVGPEIAKPPLVDLLMPVLIERWNKIQDDSREMFPLLGCLGYIAMAYGDTFAQFTPPIFDRCIKLIYANLQQHMAFMSGQTVDQPDKDFIVTALDLLSAIIQAISPEKSAPLVQNSQPQFFDLLSFCMEDPTTDVRQSAYAVLGDCAIALYPSLDPYLPKLIPILIRQLDLDAIPDTDSENGFNVLANVCWSLGEIAARAPTSRLDSFVEPLYRGLLSLITNEEVPDAASENAGTALGRLGLSCPVHLAPFLGELAEPFLQSMGKISTSHEKASAFIGFNNILEKNPQAMEQSLALYMSAIAQFPLKGRQGQEYNDVRASFARVVDGFAGLIGKERFEGFVAGLSAPVRAKLRDGYGVGVSGA
ncbi:Importin subunit beta-2 [Cladophialophora carrionii]|uniref:Importin subunit beta-2 n=1 Tax=Cladophialophora carrionii TaxID=86049 RepID=A0A1C1C777_9EURO|nr:Importin subunit beta-2 [Cladophialophora carrionii]